MASALVMAFGMSLLHPPAQMARTSEVVEVEKPCQEDLQLVAPSEVVRDSVDGSLVARRQ